MRGRSTTLRDILEEVGAMCGPYHTESCEAFCGPRDEGWTEEDKCTCGLTKARGYLKILAKVCQILLDHQSPWLWGGDYTSKIQKIISGGGDE